MKIIGNLLSITGFVAFAVSIVLAQPNLMLPGLALLALALVMDTVAGAVRKIAQKPADGSPSALT